MGSILAVMIWGLGWDSPGAPSPIDPKWSALVTRLGHDLFRVRENAGRELIRAGQVAMPAVRAGTKSANPEVAARCQHLLQAIPEAGRLQKIDQLLKTPGGPVPKGMPGIDRFLSITGDTREARQVYAEMWRNHHEILNLIQCNPGEIAEKLVHFSRDVCELARTKPRSPDEPTEWQHHVFSHKSEVALFLFIRSDARIMSDVHESIEEKITTAKLMQKMILDSEFSSVFRKLFVEWYRNEKNLDLVANASDIVANGGMQKLLLPSILRRLENSEKDNSDKMVLLATVCRLGDRQTIPQVERFLDDRSTTMGWAWCDRNANAHFFEVTVGDVALSVCWILAGRNQDDLGTMSQFLEPDEKQMMSLCFKSSFEFDHIRVAAHATWKKMRAELLKPNTEKTARQP